MDSESNQQQGVKSIEEQAYINQAHEDLTYSITQFDNQVLYLSSGAFALGLTFLKDITPINEAVCLPIFIISMVLFTVSILLSFSSHLIGHEISIVNIKRLDKGERPKEYQLVRILNWIMASTLILGIFGLLIFSSINIYKMSDKKEQPAGKVVNSIKDSVRVENKGVFRPIPQIVAGTTATQQPSAQQGSGTQQPAASAGSNNEDK